MYGLFLDHAGIYRLMRVVSEYSIGPVSHVDPLDTKQSVVTAELVMDRFLSFCSFSPHAIAASVSTKHHATKITPIWVPYLGLTLLLFLVAEKISFLFSPQNVKSNYLADFAPMAIQFWVVCVFKWERDRSHIESVHPNLI